MQADPFYTLTTVGRVTEGVKESLTCHFVDFLSIDTTEADVMATWTVDLGDFFPPVVEMLTLFKEPLSFELDLSVPRQVRTLFVTSRLSESANTR